MHYREEAGVPADSSEIELDGVRLAVARDGQGPAVVCLHAIGHGGGDFADFASAVKDRFEVIRIDWPGQGRSGPDPKPLSPARYAELLGGVLDQLKIESPIIIGNSIGGAAAIIHAQDHPVRALVLCDTGGLVPVSRLSRAFCGAFARFFAGGERRAWWFKPMFCAYYRFMVLPGRAAAKQRERIVNSSYEIAPILHEAWAGFAKPDADIRHIASRSKFACGSRGAEKTRSYPCSRACPASGS